ncbi:unnamed protein product [Gongylonema pulchrum]|uniref:DAGKa domain-containing protein n=1 Tax=Gongylonema pulchrum TaxID=637853 RepID=A0A183ESL0_9BILA|nr:unnamed protein product [Gongylonema pulchrum]
MGCQIAIVTARVILLFRVRTHEQSTYLRSCAEDVLEHACASLHEKLELIVDGSLVPLPPIEGLTVINIPFWGAGVRPWTEMESPQAFGDGMYSMIFFENGGTQYLKI